MTIEFVRDEAKAATNLAKHGVAFDDIRRVDFDLTVIRTDGRRNYGEVRQVATGPIGDRLHVLVFILRGEAMRVISLRKANQREALRYLADIEEMDDG